MTRGVTFSKFIRTYFITGCPIRFNLVLEGVVGTTRGLINRLTWQLNEFPWLPGREEVVLQRTPLTFVDSLAEIFSAILSAVQNLSYHLMILIFCDQ